MERTPTTQTSHLHRMPQELIHAILSCVQGLEGLRCAILSCHLPYYAFSENRSAIAQRVLFNDLDVHNVRREAIIAFHASKIARADPTVSTLQVFIQELFQERTKLSTIQLTLDELGAISRLHAVVSRLADDFSSKTIPELAKVCGNVHPDNPTIQAPETARIMRALYVAEIFFNLFRNTPEDTLHRQFMNDLLAHLAPWEIKQLSCVHDFLFLQVSPAFNEMVAHDIFWGEFSVEPALWFGSPEMQFFLFEGLATIERIAAAKTYAQQRLVFRRIPDMRQHNLHRALKEFSSETSTAQDASNFSIQNASVSNLATLQDCTLDVECPFFEDCNDSPFMTWKWAQETDPPPNHGMLRRIGYVMWNQERLDALRILHQQQPQVADEYLPNDDPVHEVTDKTFLSSWRERSRIYLQGGTGWWDFDDESQIEWPRRRKTLIENTVPTSLDEAKRTILALKRP